MVDYAEIVQGGDEAVLRAFIAAYVSNSLTNERTQVFIGQLPIEEPLHSLPIPAQTEILGSVEQLQQHTQLLLVSQLTSAEVRAHYEKALTKLGWQVGGGVFMPYGFRKTEMEMFHFCSEAHHQMINGQIQTDEDRTYIRLTVSKALHPCHDPREHMKYMSAMPNLSAPQGVFLLPSSFSSGSTGGMDHFEARTSAVARWQGGLRDLYRAYVPLLESVGWALGTESITDKAAVSWWDVTLDDETWQGIFSVLAKPKSPEHYTLTLTLELSII